VQFETRTARNLLKAEERLEKEREDGSTKKVSRREFLKYGVGVAAVAAGATALMGKIPLPEGQPATKTPAANDSSEPIVATVKGDQVTVMNGQTIIKTRDPGLAALIAEKMNEGE
jgi:hypothetical protein